MFNTSSQEEELGKFSKSRCPPLQPVSIHYIGNKGGLFNAADCFEPYQTPLQSQYQPMRQPQQVQISQNFRTTSASVKRCWDEMSDQEESFKNGRVSSSLPFCPNQEIQSFNNGRFVSDEEAAAQIEKLFRWAAKRRHDQLTGRILRDLITRRGRLDDHSLDNLLLAADKIIFDGKLRGRVCWRWSEYSETQYEHDLLGTTALRPAPPALGGFRTQIVLSKQLLQNEEFNRDLLLSAFFHELVHCYLFIQCGLEHAMHDGHTPGFRKIASLIDKWFGNQRLHLCNMRANLDHFRVSEETGCRGADIPMDEGYQSRVMWPEYVGVQDCKIGCGVQEQTMMQDIIIWDVRQSCTNTVDDKVFRGCQSSTSWC